MEPVYKEKAVTNRDLIELAVKAGRHFQSQTTGFVHLEDQIPVYENALFALALLRSRTVDHVQEAKQLIDRLLHFQNQQCNDDEGSFPRFLHEYPRCEHTLLGTLLLPVFYMMLRQFHTILGEGLRTRLEDAIEDLMNHQMRIAIDHRPPAHLSSRLGSTLVAYGEWKENSELVAFGRDLITYHNVNSPAHLADLLIAAQIEGTELPPSLLKHVVSTFHPATLSYSGPAAQEFQRAGEPEVTLYDYLLANLTGRLSARAQRLRHVQLQAALVQPTDQQLPQAEYKSWALSLLDRTENFNWALSPAMSPLRLHWGSGDRVRSFVLQGGMSTVTSRSEGDQVELTITLPAENDPEDRNKCREIAFYIDASCNPELSLNGQRTNTFRLGEVVEFGDSILKLEMQVIGDDSDAGYLCHLQRANRPAEREPAHPGQDWAIYVRTLRREGPTRLRVSLRVIELQGREREEDVALGTVVSSA